MNIKKALEMNPELGEEPKTEEKTETKLKENKQNKKEITITSDEVDINYS